MTPNPFPESRLLSGRNHMSVLEREQILTQVLKQSASRSRSKRLVTWWLAATAGAAVASAAVLLLLVHPVAKDEDSFASRGTATDMGFSLSCSNPSGETTCHDGSTLLFRTWAPTDTPYFASFARADDGTIIWYAPTNDQALSVDTRAAGPGGVLSHGVHIGPEHKAGTYTVYGLFSTQALRKDDVRALVERSLAGEAVSAQLFNVNLAVDATP